MLITLKIFRIKWETDGIAVIYLPNKVILEIDLKEDANDQICNLLSDEYGWLVNDYEVQGYDSDANYALQMQQCNKPK